MTTTQFMALSWREQDALVADKIMKQEKAPPDKDIAGTFDGFWLPYAFYTTDIAAAWPLVERFKMNISCWRRGGEPSRWSAESESDTINNTGYAYDEADTAPLVICLAALKAVGFLRGE